MSRMDHRAWPELKIILFLVIFLPFDTKPKKPKNPRMACFAQTTPNKLPELLLYAILFGWAHFLYADGALFNAVTRPTQLFGLTN